MKKIFDKKFLGLIIGVIFIALILKDIDIKKSLEVLKHVNFAFIFLMIPAYFSAFLFRALRWKTILEKNKKVSITSLLNAIFRGWAVNNVVPARGGELYRAHFFGKKEDISRATILASIILERIFDGIVLFLILLSLVSFVYSSKKFFGVAIVAGIVFVGGFVGLLLMSKFYKNTFIKEKFNILILKIREKNFIKRFLNEKICEILSKIFNKITYSVISFMNGLEVFNYPSLILKSFFFTVLVWLCEGMTTLLLIKGFGYSIGVLGSLFVLSIIAFASLIPGGPAGLGPVQWGYIVALKFFNISQETAFAVSIIGQIFMVSVVSLGSLFFILSENFNLKEEKLVKLEN